MPLVLNVWLSSASRDQPSFTPMPYGVLAHIPVVHLPTHSIAIMQSADHVPVGLVLVCCSQAPSDLRNPLYHCGLPGSQRFVRLNVTPQYVPGRDLAPQWQDVQLVARPAFRANEAPMAIPRELSRTSMDPRIPFRISSAAMNALRQAHEVFLRKTGPVPSPGAWERGSPATLVFRARYELCIICIDLGVCASSGEPWARARLRDHDVPIRNLIAEGAGKHLCPGYHVARWERGARTFRAAGVSGGYDRKYSLAVELVFSTFFLDPKGKILELQNVGYTWK